MSGSPRQSPSCTARSLPYSGWDLLWFGWNFQKAGFWGWFCSSPHSQGRHALSWKPHLEGQGLAGQHHSTFLPVRLLPTEAANVLLSRAPQPRGSCPSAILRDPWGVTLLSDDAYLPPSPSFQAGQSRIPTGLRFPGWWTLRSDWLGAPGLLPSSSVNFLWWGHITSC